MGLCFFIFHILDQLCQLSMWDHIFLTNLCWVAARRCKFTFPRINFTLKNGKYLWNSCYLCNYPEILSIIQRFFFYPENLSIIEILSINQRFCPFSRDSVHKPEILSITKRFFPLARDSVYYPDILCFIKRCCPLSRDSVLYQEILSFIQRFCPLSRDSVLYPEILSLI